MRAIYRTGQRRSRARHQFNLPEISYICIMRIRKSYVLILVAYCMAIVHASVPHQHSSLLGGEEVYQSRNAEKGPFSGLLQSVFSTDLGCGHLEDYNKSDAKADFSLTIAPVLPDLFFAYCDALESNQNTPEYSGSYIEKLQLRTILFS